MPSVRIEVEALHPDAVVPAQSHPSDAGYDLTALGEYELGPGERATLGTGIAVAIPHGFVGYIKPRSGLAARHGIDVLGGVIDSGYRGEIGVILVNTGDTDFLVTPGDRIAQLVIQPVMDALFQQVPVLPGHVRGTGGFGSTGVSNA